MAATSKKKTAKGTARKSTKKSASKAAKKTARKPRPSKSDEARWTFLTNHSHVLICLSIDPDMTLREVSNRVGITERSVQRVLAELEAGGYLERERLGSRNRYTFRKTSPLRHPVEEHCTIGDLVDMVEKKLR